MAIDSPAAPAMAPSRSCTSTPDHYTSGTTSTPSTEDSSSLQSPASVSSSTSRPAAAAAMAATAPSFDPWRNMVSPSSVPFRWEAAPGKPDLSSDTWKQQNSVHLQLPPKMTTAAGTVPSPLPSPLHQRHCKRSPDEHATPLHHHHKVPLSWKPQSQKIIRVCKSLITTSSNWSPATSLGLLNCRRNLGSRSGQLSAAGLGAAQDDVDDGVDEEREGHAGLQEHSRSSFIAARNQKLMKLCKSMLRVTLWTNPLRSLQYHVQQHRSDKGNVIQKKNCHSSEGHGSRQGQFAPHTDEDVHHGNKPINHQLHQGVNNDRFFFDKASPHLGCNSRITPLYDEVSEVEFDNLRDHTSSAPWQSFDSEILNRTVSSALPPITETRHCHGESPEQTMVLHGRSSSPTQGRAASTSSATHHPPACAPSPSQYLVEPCGRESPSHCSPSSIELHHDRIDEWLSSTMVYYPRSSFEDPTQHSTVEVRHNKLPYTRRLEDEKQWQAPLKPHEMESCPSVPWKVTSSTTLCDTEIFNLETRGLPAIKVRVTCEGTENCSLLRPLPSSFNDRLHPLSMHPMENAIKFDESPPSSPESTISANHKHDYSPADYPCQPATEPSDMTDAWQNSMTVKEERPLPDNTGESPIEILSGKPSCHMLQMTSQLYDRGLSRLEALPGGLHFPCPEEFTTSKIQCNEPSWESITEVHGREDFSHSCESAIQTHLKEFCSMEVHGDMLEDGLDGESILDSTFPHGTKLIPLATDVDSSVASMWVSDFGVEDGEPQRRVNKKMLSLTRLKSMLSKVGDLGTPFVRKSSQVRDGCATPDIESQPSSPWISSFSPNSDVNKGSNAPTISTKSLIKLKHILLKTIVKVKVQRKGGAYSEAEIWSPTLATYLYNQQKENNSSMSTSSSICSEDDDDDDSRSFKLHLDRIPMSSIRTQLSPYSSTPQCLHNQTQEPLEVERMTITKFEQGTLSRGCAKLRKS